MNVLQMHIELNLVLQKNASNQMSNFLSEEVDVWLNKAQERLIRERFDFVKIDQRIFESRQVRIDDLRLLVTNSLLTLNSSFTGQSIFDIPEDYMFLINNHSKVTVCGNPKEVENRLVGHEELYNILNDPFEKPHLVSPISVLTDKLTVYHQGNLIVNSTSITYIRIPQEIKLVLDTEGDYDSYNPTSSKNCELSIHTHREIIDKAVEMILESIENPRYQTKLNDNITNE